jgi:hypothetical protein
MSLFEKAKTKQAAKPAAKKSKDEVVVSSNSDFANLKRLEELKLAKAQIEAEEAIIYGQVKTLGVCSFNNKYQEDGKFTDSFKVVVKTEDSQQSGEFLFAPTDRYIKIDEDRATFLKNKYGEEVVSEETVYTLDKDMVQEYGQIISDLLENCTLIKEADKAKIIKAETATTVKKGVIKLFRSNDRLRKFNCEELTNDFQPVFMIKGVKVEEVEA